MIITLPRYPLTRSAEMRGCKYWVKRLDKVDTSKSDGYAFEGRFEKPGATVEVPAGTWFLDYCKDVSQSGRVRGQEVELYQAADGGLVSRRKFDLDGSAGWALRCRDEIAAILTGPPAAAEPDLGALRAEREKLLARVAEIDTVLLSATPEADWDCDAYGHGARKAGALCYFADPGTRNCGTQDECRRSVAAARQLLFQRINELAAGDDPSGAYGHLAQEIASPGQLLGGGADHA